MEPRDPESLYTVTRISTVPNDATDAASSSFPVVQGYHLTDLIGRGSISTVYLAQDVRTADPRAIKVYDDAASDFAALERDALRGLSHPHLVRCYGGIEAELPGGVLREANIFEYVPGGSALNVVRSMGPQSLGQVSAIMVPLASAVDYLHSQGVTHGDITPDNVLFAGDGSPKLIDGSIAQRAGARHFDAGTAGFHAPEPLDEDQLQPARDVYSLGAMLWFLLTGRVPSLTSNRPALSVMLGAVSSDLVDLVEACLDEDPAGRPGAGDVARRLRKMTSPEPIDITVISDDHAVPYLRTSHHFDREAFRKRERRRTRTMWTSVAAAAVLAVAGVMMMLMPSPQQDDEAVALVAQTVQEEAVSEQPEGLIAELEALSAARDKALVEQDDAALESVHAADSRSLNQDRRTVQELKKNSLKYQDLQTTLTNVQVTELAPAGKATVRADSRTSEFSVHRAADGRSLPVNALPVQQLEFTLVKEDNHWQIADVALLAEMTQTG